MTPGVSKYKAQQWFNKNYSDKETTEVMKIVEDLTRPLTIKGFINLKIIILKKFDLSLPTGPSIDLKINHCSELNDVKISNCNIKSLSMSGYPKLTSLD